MKTIKITALASIVTAMLSSMALADVPVARGSYFDINVGYSKIVNANAADNVTGLGLNLNLGYKFMPFFALEGGYTTYGASKSSFVGANAIDLAIKGIIPFQEVGMELFAKIGPDYVNNSKVPDDISPNAFNVYYAVGGAYAFAPASLITLQWSQANGNSNTGNFQLFSIGLTYIL